MPKPSRSTAKKTLRFYWREIAKDKRTFAAYALMVPLNRLGFVVLLPLAFSFIVQSLIKNPHDWGHPLLLLGLAVLAAGMSITCSWFGFPLLWRHEEQMKTSLTAQAIRRLLSHSDQFFANRKIGSLAGDLASFTQAQMTMMDTLFLTASGVIVSYVFSLLIIAFLAPMLLIPLVILTAFLIWHSFHALKSRSELRHERKDRISLLNGTVSDVLGNQQIVRFFAMGRKESNRVINERQAIERVAIREVAVIARESLFRQSIIFGFQFAIMGFAIYLVAHDQISIGALVFTVTYLARLTNSMFELTPIIRSFEQAFMDSAAMTEIMDETVEIDDKPRAKKLKVTKGHIVFDKIHFAYKDNLGESVINDLSLDVKPGERIGLAGHSGGGKTTLSKLLLRFSDIQKGAITIDGQDISEVTQDSLHEAIAYVPQEAYLFHRTLRENISYGRPEASDDEIMEAAKRANALEFIETLPNGLDTVVGERGVKLSGGQRQRIAIARAILKDAPILVLDEATSALDSESEKLIQEALTKLMKGRTSIVIAHRLSTIAQLDRIIVIDKGTIIEDGPHKTLLEHDGTYAKLWAHQSGGFIS